MESDRSGNNQELYEKAKIEEDDCHASSQLLETVIISDFVLLISDVPSSHFLLTLILYHCLFFFNLKMSCVYTYTHYLKIKRLRND